MRAQLTTRRLTRVSGNVPRTKTAAGRADRIWRGRVGQRGRRCWCRERVSEPRGGEASESCVESMTVRLSRSLDDTFMFSALNGRVRWRNVAQ
jgi:hypothetical protein